jgi:hypothetical protein
MSDIVLSVPVDAGGVDPLLASLEKINQNLIEINKTSKGSFDAFSKSLDKSNKKLKETDKTFGDIFKKIKLSGLMKMGAGVIGAGAGLLGISTGAMLFGALKNSAGVVATGYQGAGLGMSSAEIKALQTASKLSTGKEETLVTAMTNLSNALNSAEGGSALAALGLNQEQLKAMSPEKALEAVFNAVKGKGTGIGSEYLRSAFGSVTELSGQDYNVATKQGAAFGADYRSFLTKYAGVDFDELGRGARSLIEFQTQLDIVSQKIGGSLADPLAGLLEKLSPHIEKLGDYLAKVFDSITQEDVDKFCSAVEKIFKFIFDIAGKVWDVGESTVSVGKAVVNQFTPEGREENKKNYEKNVEKNILAFMSKSMSVRDIWKSNPEIAKAGVELGYISKEGEYTQKSRDLLVTVVVKDPAGKVLSTAVATNGNDTTKTPLNGWKP